MGLSGRICRVVACITVILSTASAWGAVVSDRAAAILIWPDVFVGEFSPGVVTTDTVLQLTNTSTEPILAHCFYENATPHCANTGEWCFSSEQCCDSGGCSSCKAGWQETDFRVRLTPRQPLGWSALQGLSTFPLSGRPGEVGPDGSSNAGSRIPPVPERVFNGELKCIAVNDDGTPSDRNVLIGNATRLINGPQVAKSNALGFRAIEGAVNDDRELVLGGPDAEYEGCPNFLILNHFFDLGGSPAADGWFSFTRLILVPCTQDLLRQVPGTSVVQFLVYNEFEQRFSTSRRVSCKADYLLSNIDTTDRERSIFSAGVAGTLSGQSRLNPIGSGLVGVATESLLTAPPVEGFIPDYSGRAILERIEDGGGSMADINIHEQGDRPDADLITLP